MEPKKRMEEVAASMTGTTVVRPGAGRHLALLGWLYLAGLAVVLVLGRRYLEAVPAGTSLVGWCYTLAAWISTLASILLIPFLILAMPVAGLRSAWFTAIAPAAVGFAAAFLVLADAVIYRLYGCHFNPEVWNLISTPSAHDSFTIGAGTWWTAFGTLSVAALALAAAAEWARRAALGRAPAPRGCWLGAVAGAMLVVIAVDKFGYAYGDACDLSEVLRVRGYFPLYQAVTMRRFAAARLGIHPTVERTPGPRPAGMLDYPKAPLAFRADGARPNIVVVAIEGCRADMLDAAVMPALWRWSQGQLVGRDHWTGGPATRFGLFALLYGVDATYWNAFLAERRGPALIDALRGFGYAFDILSCTDLGSPEFRQTAFVEVSGAVVDQWPVAKVERDRMMTDRFIADLERLRTPFYSFLFYDASHQPYLYPPQHQRFTPVSDVSQLDYIKLADDPGKLVGPLFNRYRNSLGYVDEQLARVIAALEAHGMMDDTLLFIVGDHGEEFAEAGRVGHNSAFDQWQMRTTAVFHLPGVAAGEITRPTSHVDIVPTILARLGLINPLADCAQGTPLTASTGPQWLVAAKWEEAAILDSRGAIVFGTEATSLGIRCFDADYRPTSSGAPGQRQRLIEMLARMRQFSR